MKKVYAFLLVLFTTMIIYYYKEYKPLDGFRNTCQSRHQQLELINDVQAYTPPPKDVP